jgi:hypothetical protein
MEVFPKIQTLFKRDLDGSITGKKGKMLEGQWTTPELEYLAGNEWEFTEKVDGTNIRIHMRLIGDHHGGKILWVDYAGRTDNAVIPKPLLEHLEKVFPTRPMNRRDLSRPGYTARYEELAAWMEDSDLESLVLFGEGYGPKIQGGGKYRDDTSFVLFDVKIGDFWLSRENVDDVAAKLGIDSVPVIGTGTLYQAINIVKGDGMEWVTENGRTFGRSTHGDRLTSQWGDFEAEGIVARPVVDLFNRKGERIICKIKAVDFR